LRGLLLRGGEEEERRVDRERGEEGNGGMEGQGRV